MKKILISVLLCFLSLIGIMKLLILFNRPDLVTNLLAICGIVILVYTIIITRAFTKFNLKKNQNNEKNS
jgi:phosphotransferase system  glucose/maltose/N-acetylglucosamine-specific IIC component